MYASISESFKYHFLYFHNSRRVFGVKGKFFRREVWQAELSFFTVTSAIT